MVSVIPEDLLEMQILRLHSSIKETNSGEMLICVLRHLPGSSDVVPNFQRYCLGNDRQHW